MKIRAGFVTNSSSTSFIVAFDRELVSKNDVKTLVQTLVKKHGIAGITEKWDSLARTLDYPQMPQGTRTAFGDMLGDYLWRCIGPCVHPAKHDPEQCGACDQCEDYADSPWRRDKDDRPFRDRLKEFVAANQDKHIYHVHVGDDDDIGAILEHGELLRLMPHIAVNMH